MHSLHDGNLPRKQHLLDGLLHWKSHEKWQGFWSVDESNEREALSHVMVVPCTIHWDTQKQLIHGSWPPPSSCGFQEILHPDWVLFFVITAKQLSLRTGTSFPCDQQINFLLRRTHANLKYSTVTWRMNNCQKQSKRRWRWNILFSVQECGSQTCRLKALDRRWNLITEQSVSIWWC